MNKTTIKNFAIWARNKLIADIVYQAGLLGVTEKGIANALPQSSREVQFFDIGTKDYITVRGNAIRQRDAFVAAIKAKQVDTDYISAFRFVVEKVAYTWFNRLIAIRFMEVNDYLPGRVRVLSSENPSKAEPDMVTRPFDTDISFSAQERNEIMRMKDDNKLDELFRMLFIKQCQKLSEVLPSLFDAQGIERADSYLELLLTISFTDKDGVLWHLVNDIKEKYFRVRTPEDDELQKTNGIPEDDMPVGQIEIIGWLYQYYNTEPKQQVFDNLKKNIKINKDSIPAATQLFTPDWIVRYMVENSLGRLWVEGHVNEELKKNWKYYLEETNQEPQVQKNLAVIREQYASIHPEELKVIDPCMGSGHILICLFDVLMQIYESQGWTQREAAQSIVQNNLYGLDIDDRAAQLAYFAVMMKARQYDRRFLDRGIVPHIYGIQESNGINPEHIRQFGSGMNALEKNNALNQLNAMLDALHDAKEYGSILNVPEFDWDLLYRYTAGLDTSVQISMDNIGADDTLLNIRKLIGQAQAMAQKYHVVVTNPPYMGASGMASRLSQYVKDNYPDSKSDLFSVFIDRGFEMLKPFGFEAMITMESWMFLSSFEELRRKICNKKTIITMVHMPYLGKGGTSLGINFGTEMAVIQNNKCSHFRGIYDRIAYYETDEEGVPFSFPTKNEYYKAIMQEQFSKIPGSPIAYWVSENIFSAFEKEIKIEAIGNARQGIIPGNVDEFLRIWSEVDKNKIGFSHTKYSDISTFGMKWFPYNKGGAYRRWYGNIIHVINMWNNGYDIKYSGKNNNYRLREPELYFQSAVTWSKITTGKFSARWMPKGYLFDIAGCCIFDLKDENYVLGFTNSKVCTSFLKIVSPTINCEVEHMKSLPIIFDDEKRERIDALVQENISLSQEDWNSFEISWDYFKHPLIRNTHSIEAAYRLWEVECQERFDKLKKNEIELNCIFIDMYKLQNELSADIDDSDITVRKAELEREIHSFISYAVGCMFGRYSLDKNGLQYAGGEWDESQYLSYKPDPDNCLPITDEPYFEDDIVGRFVDFVRSVYGEHSLEENLDFIAKALGNKGNTSREIIRNYFLTDFFKDHCSVYSVNGSGKRPIYWLFDSGKQNGFKALVYMHRWSADTVGNLRVEYLHRMQRVYEKEIERMQDIIDNSKDNREVNQASKRREKLVKQLKEARDYDAKIAHAALSRVEIDLDDGVKVNYEKVQKGPDGKSLGILAKI